MKTGRPNKLTPDVKKTILDAIALGLSYKDSCAIAGISYTTFQNWINKGEEKKTGEFFKFLVEVKKAIAKGKLSKVKRIDSDPSWQSDAWLLERQYPEEYGRREKVEHSGKFEIAEFFQKLDKDEKG